MSLPTCSFSTPNLFVSRKNLDNIELLQSYLVKMENVGHQSDPRLVKGHKKSHKGRRKKGNVDDPLKVVYISNPMKVKTSASRFRSLVQQLTGKNSDITRYNIEADTSRNGTSDFHEIDCRKDDQEMGAKEVSENHLALSSGSQLGTMDNHVLRSHEMDYDQFAGIFSFSDLSQLDEF